MRLKLLILQFWSTVSDDSLIPGIMLTETSGPNIDVFEHDEERNGATLVLPSPWLRLSPISFSPIPALKTM